jgi:hypothetical protein
MTEWFTVFRHSPYNEVNRYQCPNCEKYQLVLFNPVKEANFEYCPKCGVQIVAVEE